MKFRELTLSLDALFQGGGEPQRCSTARSLKIALARNYELVCLTNPFRNFVFWVEDDVINLFHVYEDSVENKDLDSWVVHSTFEGLYYKAERENSGLVSIHVAYQESGIEACQDWRIESHEYLRFWANLIATLEASAKAELKEEF